MICGLLEIEIMNSVWALQKKDEDMNISVAHVVEYLEENKISRAYTTIKTVMDRLSTKDLLVRYRDGKKFYYRSTFDKEEIARETLNEISGQFFNGNYVEMLRFVESQCKELLV